MKNIQIPITKTDEDKRLVFGWANLPRPANVRKDATRYIGVTKSDVGISEDDSLEGYIGRISAAHTYQYPSPNYDGYGMGYSCVEATFPTFIIVGEYGPGGECKYYQVAYVVEGESIAFGQHIEVEEVYVAKTIGKSALPDSAASMPDDIIESTREGLGKSLMESYAISAKSGHIKTDLQDDAVPLQELEKAAYEFVLESRVGGENHERAVGMLVESFFATEEKYVAMGIPKEVAKNLSEGWFVGFKIQDEDTWKGVKEGKFSMFSIGGSAKRHEIE